MYCSSAFPSACVFFLTSFWPEFQLSASLRPDPTAINANEVDLGRKLCQTRGRKERASDITIGSCFIFDN